MTDINLKTLTPDTSLPTTGFLFGADSQASTNPSVYSTQTVATTLLGSTSLTGDVLTADAPVLNLAQTWSNAAITFTGIKYNATNTNSSAGSMMMDLQVGGTSYFNVARNGTTTVQTTLNLINGANTPIQLNAAQKALACTLDFVIKWQSSTSSLSGVDYAFFGVRTTSTAANPIFRFGAADAAAPVAQTLSVQSVVAGPTTNTPGADFKITGSQGIGSGAGGSIIFQVAPAGSPANPAQNALADALTIGGNRVVTVATKLVLALNGEMENYNGTLNINNNGMGLGTAASLSFANSANGNGSKDASISRAAANIVQIGTGTNNASGTLKAAVVGTTTAYTVATLPTGFQGARAFVTDATLPTYLGTLTGGGAVVCPVFYNGTAWVSA